MQTPETNTWRRLPLEPTPEIVQAIESTIRDALADLIYDDPISDIYRHGVARDVYRAILAAAPAEERQP